MAARTQRARGHDRQPGPLRRLQAESAFSTLNEFRPWRRSFWGASAQYSHFASPLRIPNGNLGIFWQLGIRAVWTNFSNGTAPWKIQNLTVGIFWQCGIFAVCANCAMHTSVPVALWHFSSLWHLCQLCNPHICAVRTLVSVFMFAFFFCICTNCACRPVVPLVLWSLLPQWYLLPHGYGPPPAAPRRAPP
jgi:hypothetical protein